VLLCRRLFFQAAQPRRQRAAPDPHGPAGQPHHRRPGPEPTPAVERRPGHPQLGGHLLDRQQRVIRGAGCSGRDGGGPTGNGARSRGRPVRGSGSTDAQLRPPRQVRPPVRGSPGRSCRAGEQEEQARPGRRPRQEQARRRGRAWRAARPGRRGRPAGAGAGSRAVTDGTPSPLPRVETAGSAAGQRGALACRPGPQASSLHSGRPVKSTPPCAGPGLTSGPQPRTGTGRHPPRPEERTPLGRAGYREGGTAACTAKVRAGVVPAPAGRQPGGGAPARWQRVMLTGELVISGFVPRAAALLTHYINPVPRVFFHAFPRNGCWRGRAARLLPEVRCTSSGPFRSGCPAGPSSCSPAAIGPRPPGCSRRDQHRKGSPAPGG
jgi:hypothetical protein